MMWGSFLFSCLIDADRINSADFEKEEQSQLRSLNYKPDWQSAIDKLEAKLAGFESRYPIDAIRQQTVLTLEQLYGSNSGIIVARPRIQVFS